MLWSSLSSSSRCSFVGDKSDCDCFLWFSDDEVLVSCGIGDVIGGSGSRLVGVGERGFGMVIDGMLEHGISSFSAVTGGDNRGVSPGGGAGGTKDFGTIIGRNDSVF